MQDCEQSVIRSYLQEYARKSAVECSLPNKSLQKKQLLDHLKKIAEKEKKKFNIPSPCPLPSFLSFVCQHCGAQNNDRLTQKCLNCHKVQKKTS